MMSMQDPSANNGTVLRRCESLNK
uniref:Uncharacterized protein n=1 Tax=Anopheles minimus TaxID=112268 RepID=A0A182WP10_9DIPT